MIEECSVGADEAGSLGSVSSVVADAIRLMMMMMMMMMAMMMMMMIVSSDSNASCRSSSCQGWQMQTMWSVSSKWAADCLLFHVNVDVNGNKALHQCVEQADAEFPYEA